MAHREITQPNLYIVCHLEVDANNQTLNVCDCKFMTCAESEGGNIKPFLNTLYIDFFLIACDQKMLFYL